MNQSYIFKPSLRGAVIQFLSRRPREDTSSTKLTEELRTMRPSYLIGHALSQAIVGYLSELPFKDVYQLINEMGSMEPVPVDEPLTTSPPAPDVHPGNNGISQDEVNLASL